ncbi:MAG: cold shock CspA family protein, partial [Rickettsiales bacterium]
LQTLFNDSGTIKTNDDGQVFVHFSILSKYLR